VASIRESTELHTARFQCITDRDGNQLASFYAGAMSLARRLDLQATVDRLTGVDQVVIGPNDPEAMLRHTDECRARDYPFSADPSQQLAVMEPKEIRRLIEGARFLFTNAYEHALVLQKTEWTEREVLSRVETWVTTLGPAGARIEQAGRRSVQVRAVPVPEPVDPTGVGDAFRAGFLAAVHAGQDHELAAQLGCTLAALVLRTVGPQEYDLDRRGFLDDLTASYGPHAAARTVTALGW
jgi:adenosine kinase